MSNDDIWYREERVSFNEDNEYFECSCGWFGDDAIVLDEFGMTFYICPNCAQEVY